MDKENTDLLFDWSQWIVINWKWFVPTLTAFIAGVWTIGWLLLDYHRARRVEVPMLKKEKHDAEVALQKCQISFATLQKSMDETDALRRAIATVQGEIRHITRNVFISFDESSPSLLTQKIDDQLFQWNVRIKKEPDGRYNGAYSQRMWGPPNLEEKEEQADDFLIKSVEAHRKMLATNPMFLNAADRIDLESQDPQLIGTTSPGISTFETNPSQYFDIYIVVEKTDPTHRRWQCSLIATVKPKEPKIV